MSRVARIRPANAAQAARWNGESAQYWIANHDRLTAAHRRLTSHLLRAAAISSGERVLDIGCGCGATTIAAARAAAPAPGAVTGLDLSGPMLRFARQLTARSGATNAAFAQCDAQDCPVLSASCDLIISSFGVMFFDDPAAAFASMAAATRPGGRLAFLCWQDDAHNELSAIPARTLVRSEAPPRTAVASLFADPARIRHLLAAAGWTEITITPVREQARIGANVADVMNYVRSMPMICGLSTAIRDRRATRRALDDIAEQYAARQQPDGIWVQAAAWLAVARRT